jgi:hypothetical protein
VTWSSQPADGTYTIFAKGYDRANNTTDSSSVVVTVDNTAPSFTSAALSGASPAADLFIGSISGLGTGTATGNLYYNNGAAGGSFKLNVGLADAGSGLASYAFPALTGTTIGWTYTAQGSTATSGSSASVTNANTFTYALTSTGPATETATVTDAAGNTGSLALTYTKDTTGPTVSINSPAASSWNKNGQSLGVTVSDGGSGVASVAYYYCAGAQPVCNFTTGSPTLIGTASSSPWSVTWSSMPANGNYKIFAHAIDNVSNATDSAATSTTRRLPRP